MTIQETAKIMDILHVAYPQFYRGASEVDERKALTLWAEMFRDDDFQIVAAAIKALIATDEKGFPPQIGAVKARLRQITEPMRMTEGEAWALALKAIKNSAWHSEREFGKLPPDIQAAVGSPETLKTWALSDEGDLNVIASNFMRSFRTKQQASREWAALPDDIKTLAGGLARLVAGDEHD